MHVQDRACRAHRQFLGGHALAGDFASKGAAAQYPPDLSIEPIHLLVDYRLDLEAQTIDGSVTHTLRGRQGGPTRLVLHAVDFENVTCTDGDGRALHVTYDGREITIDWDEPFGEDEERTLEITFRLCSPTTGLFFSKPCELFPKRAWYAATDNETERARHWLPTIDLPAVRPTLDIKLTVDARFTALANGALVAETENDDGTKTAHWRLEQPCPSYLTCFAVGDFVSHDDGEFEGRPVASFTTRHFTSADLERSFGRTKEMLAWMQERFGFPFPYPKYFQFALPGFGGAMENISLVSWDDVFVLDETLAEEWTWLVDKINVHEMAHSYFGDLLVCRDFAHAWLKESWATYTEQLWLEHAHGRDESDYDFFSNVAAYCDEADNRYKRPIVTRNFDHSWHMYDRHLYPGGGARLHMLRKELGDDAFFAGVRLYVERHAFGTVETDDFRHALEEVSGRSLGKWFDQWIHGRGYPSLKATFAYDAKAAQGTFTIEQTQVDEKSGVAAFETALDLGWVTGDALDVRTVKLENAKHVFVVPMAQEPTQVRIDPLNRCVMSLEFDPGEAKLLAQLTGADDVPGRIRAAATLLDGGKRKRVAAVCAAYRNEAFWGARSRMAAALAKAGTQAAIEGLAELIAEEQDGMVLESLLRACTSLRAPEICAATEARLDAGLNLYRARQAAFEVLGAQRGEAPVERLIDAASTDHDPYGIGRSGAYRALAASRDERGVDVLKQQTAPGACPNRARPAATTALGAAGRWLERHRRDDVRERLEDLLRDPIDRVRDAAVAGLTALGEPAAIGALESYKGGLSAQTSAGIDRAIRGLRAAAKTDPKAKDTDLDELRKKIRALEDAVDKLQAKASADDDSAASPDTD